MPAKKTVVTLRVPGELIRDLKLLARLRHVRHTTLASQIITEFATERLAEERMRVKEENLLRAIQAG
jgi:hypothetical protein